MYKYKRQAFHYNVTLEGRPRQTGWIFADDKESANILLSRQYGPDITIHGLRKRSIFLILAFSVLLSLVFLGMSKRRFKTYFLDKISFSLKNKTGVLKSLHMVQADLKDVKWKFLLSQTIAQHLSGELLGNSLKQLEVFSDSELELINTAETNGNLADIVELVKNFHAAEVRARMESLKFIYPKLGLNIIIFFAMYFMANTVFTLYLYPFKMMGYKLPIITSLFVDFYSSYLVGAIMLSFFIVIPTFKALYLLVPPFKYMVDKTLYYLKEFRVLGARDQQLNFLISAAMARFSGLQLYKIIWVSSKVLANKSFRSQAQKCAQFLYAGGGLSEGLASLNFLKRDDIIYLEKILQELDDMNDIKTYVSLIKKTHGELKNYIINFLLTFMLVAQAAWGAAAWLYIAYY